MGLPKSPTSWENVSAWTSAYLCGPPPFFDAVAQDLKSRPQAGVHFERFSPPPDYHGQPSTVTLARSGLDVEVARRPVSPRGDPGCPA